MDEGELGVRVRRQIAEMAGTDPGTIDPAMTLIGDLALDSLQIYELAAWLEDQLGLPVLREDDIASIETVGDVESCVAVLFARGAAPGSCDGPAAGQRQDQRSPAFLQAVRNRT
jgi:acyl carrier protein